MFNENIEFERVDIIVSTLNGTKYCQHDYVGTVNAESFLGKEPITLILEGLQQSSPNEDGVCYVTYTFEHHESAYKDKWLFTRWEPIYQRRDFYQLFQDLFEGVKDKEKSIKFIYY